VVAAELKAAKKEMMAGKSCGDLTAVKNLD